jgi:protein phosphatase
MLRVVEQAFRTDTGRQRSANEDSLFASDPVFAVADGMGGAQAGEVASSVAVEAFEPGRGDGEAPEVYLKRIALEANKRINQLASEESSRSGMGTTLTAVLVDEDELAIAHVGDSRAYLYRDGVLKQLTTDHSLVEELRQQGRLTAQQAAEHPQRSIITRALGPEPSVEVDTMTYKGRENDVILLCSDGLTTMIAEERIASVLASAGGLQAAVDRLVEEANEAGGRDNITVVAFRLGASDGALPQEGETLVGPSAEQAGLTAEAVRSGAAATAASQAPTPPRETIAAQRPARSPSGAHPAAASPSPPPRRRGRTALKIGVAALVLAAVIVGGIFAARQVYFLGTDEAGRVALFRGLPYDLPFGIELYSEVESRPIVLGEVPVERRDEVTNHELRGEDDAIDLLDDIEAEASTPAETTPPTGTETPAQGDGDGGGGQEQAQQGGAGATDERP